MEIKSLTLKPERREMDGVYFAPTTISFCRGVNVFTGKGASILMDYVARSRESTWKPNEFEIEEDGHCGFKMTLFKEITRPYLAFLCKLKGLHPNQDGVTSDDCAFVYAPEICRDQDEIREIALEIVKAAKRGVQIFVSTRDYFVLQELNYRRVFPNDETYDVEFKFFSLFRLDKSEREVRICESDKIAELVRCETTEAFEALWHREEYERYMREEYEKSMREDYEKYWDERFGQ